MEKIINIEKINRAVMTGTPEEVIELCRFIHMKAVLIMSVTRPLIFWNSAKKTGLGAAASAGQSSARSATHGTPSKPSVTEMSRLPKR